jgi:hypothetical protein
LHRPAAVLPPLRVYLDPLERVWLALWQRLGLTVSRTPAVYASSDGQGGLQIGTRETLDPDDSLAQMLLHELCHALVEGPASFARPDWGLDNTDERHVPHEQAALRLQAHLLAEHGLQRVLAPTTEFRPYYDRLGETPLVAGGPEDETAVRLAVQGLERARQPPCGPWLQAALAATRTMLESAAGVEALLADPTAGTGGLAPDPMPANQLLELAPSAAPSHATSHASDRRPIRP